MYGEAADAFERVAMAQLFGDRDFVERLAALEEIDQHGEDRLVDVRVEVARANDFADGGHHLAVDEHGADNRHLRLEIVRRNAVDRRG